MPSIYVIFKKGSTNVKKNYFTKSFWSLKYPNQIAFNGEKIRVKNLMLGHLISISWHPFKNNKQVDFEAFLYLYAGPTVGFFFLKALRFPT